MPQFWRSGWTADEDQKLADLRSAGIRFADIARVLPGKSLTVIKKHWSRVLQPRLQGWARNRADRYWTEEEKQQLVRYRNKDHLPYDAIAQKLGRTVTGVFERYKRLTKELQVKQVPDRHWKPEHDRKLLGLTRAGMPLAEISRHLDRRPDVVQARLFGLRDHQEQASRLRKPGLADQIPMIADLRSQGVLWKDIATRIPGSTPKSLCTYYSKALKKRRGEAHFLERDNQPPRDLIEQTPATQTSLDSPGR